MFSLSHVFTELLETLIALLAPDTFEHIFRSGATITVPVGPLSLPGTRVTTWRTGTGGTAS